ncbi:Asp/Glu/hydantoin racemase [Thermocatellispora tengchongensis]|uniref:Asp/Glu/hydantoin racemase n=1 Tax=Thermocatellispora tengchongensis TaxID=1073253 RepID=A0A840PT83_9ACTN|nr:hypothetical protein [Thermocatellispora tengchongensis]MBB5139145.1 Asp/Glu/hydantoin racemase [Thermocatellispora tengchongensis]
MAGTAGILTAARAEALFAGSLSATTRPSREEATAAIRTSVRAHGGTRGCAAQVAACYGDYPDLAAGRMRWALATVQAIYPRRRH